jgi:hypothetical protein
VTERKYVLTRISSGDYLFPSNDGRKLLRVYRYHEDGSAMLGNGTTLRGSFWGAARFDGSLEQAERMLALDVDEFLSWGSHWESWETTLPSRSAAIRSVLKAAA